MLFVFILLFLWRWRNFFIWLLFLLRRRCLIFFFLFWWFWRLLLYFFSFKFLFAHHAVRGLRLVLSWLLPVMRRSDCSRKIQLIGTGLTADCVSFLFLEVICKRKLRSFLLLLLNHRRWFLTLLYLLLLLWNVLKRSDRLILLLFH